MRAILVAIGALAIATGCGSEQPAPTTNTAPPAPVTKAAEPLPVPADVPIPAGLPNRADSTLPGSAYHVIQGRMPNSLGDAIATVRKQAIGSGWVEIPSPGAAPVPSISTLVFHKDTREMKVTLSMIDATTTSVHLLTGPR